ncbi:hypothetical protein [Corynebacterium auriscanis]|uniref:hypothetical protein n=1 Tax=Corynebacterium auriscanis TaxID=99807 RepID=UPI0024ADCA40|nr:hypothetical protein [Corynebacterium auriscanis]
MFNSDEDVFAWLDATLPESVDRDVADNSLEDADYEWATLALAEEAVNQGELRESHLNILLKYFDESEFPGNVLAAFRKYI